MTMNDDFESILDDAEAETDGQFSLRISKLTKLTAEEIKGICPSKADQETLNELVEIVKSSATANDQKNRVLQNAQKFGGVLFSLAKKALLG